MRCPARATPVISIMYVLVPAIEYQGFDKKSSINSHYIL